MHTELTSAALDQTENKTRYQGHTEPYGTPKQTPRRERRSESDQCSDDRADAPDPPESQQTIRPTRHNVLLCQVCRRMDDRSVSPVVYICSTLLYLIVQRNSNYFSEAKAVTRRSLPSVENVIMPFCCVERTSAPASIQRRTIASAGWPNGDLLPALTMA